MNKTGKKEEIILDAMLVNTLDCATFQVQLENGHDMVAFSTPKKTLAELKLRMGDRVRIKCSPYDMLKGIILNDHTQDLPS